MIEVLCWRSSWFHLGFSMLDGQARLHRIGGIETTILLFDDHLKAVCGLAPDGQVVAQVVADSSLIADHAPSAKTQTLEKKAFPVTDHHDSSPEVPQWAMRDLNPRHLRCKRLG